MGAVARNVQRHAVQLLPVAADEVLPRPLVSRRTGARQRQFFQAQPRAEVGFLFCRSAGRFSGRTLEPKLSRKILAQNFIEDGRELLRAHGIGRGPAALVKSRSDVCSAGRIGRTLACPR